MKKLLIVHISLYSGGAERSLINFLKMFPADEFETDLLLFRREGHYIDQLPSHVRLLEPSEELLNLYYNPGSRLPRAGGLKEAKYRGLKFAGTLYGSVKTGRRNGNASKQQRWKAVYSKVIPKVEGHYDIAMAYSAGEMVYFLADKVDADRKVAWVHTDYEKTGLDPAFDLPYYEKIDAVASVSQQCIEALKRCFPTLKERFVLLPNLISESDVRAQAEEPAEEIDRTRPAIVSVGRLSYPKSPELSVAVAKELTLRGIAFCWYWLGNGNQEQEIRDLIGKEGLEDRFKLLGLKKNPYPYIKAARVLVQNSVYEGKSMVLDEAKIIGTPIVSTEYPTVYDQIGPGEGVVTAYDKKAIADAVGDLLTHPEKCDGIRSVLLSRHYGTENETCAYRTFMTGC